MTVEKTANYSDADVAVLLAAVPFDHARARELASELGKKPASIVAKINRMAAEAGKAGEWYIPKPAYVAKTGEKPESKGDIVAKIEAALEVENLAGLAKADKATLARLLAAVAVA